MWGWKYLSWIRPFESSRAFLTLRLYKTPLVLTLTLKRPCAGVLTDLKSGREPFALAWHTPRGPIFEYFLLLICFKVFFEHISFGFKYLLVTICSPRAGTRQEKLHLLPGRHFVQPGQFDVTCVELEQSFCFTSSPWQRSWQRVTWQTMNNLEVLKS